MFGHSTNRWPGARAGTPPGHGWRRLFLRLPILLYHLGLGWLLGHRFLLLHHLGRKSGLWRETVLEVVRYDKPDNTYFVASGWGEASQWYNNILRHPAVEIESGGRRMNATARRVSQAEAEAEFRHYAARHPLAFRGLAEFMTGQQVSGTSADFRRLAERIPVIALQVKSKS
ncbi:MAG: nitroreductase family deazaflavin-dependent oxidoreductase [Blastocatellia bacterium]